MLFFDMFHIWAVMFYAYLICDPLGVILSGLCAVAVVDLFNGSRRSLSVKMASDALISDLPEMSSHQVATQSVFQMVLRITFYLHWLRAGS